MERWDWGGVMGPRLHGVTGLGEGGTPTGWDDGTGGNGAPAAHGDRTGGCGGMEAQDWEIQGPCGRQ